MLFSPESRLCIFSVISKYPLFKKQNKTFIQLLFLGISSLGLYQLGGFSGLTPVSGLSSWLFGGWLNQDGFRWTSLSTSPSPRRHMAAGQSSQRKRGSTLDFLRPRLQTDTKSLPPNSVIRASLKNTYIQGVRKQTLSLDQRTCKVTLQSGWTQGEE